MKRFGSIFPFLEQGRRASYIGRLGANADFVEALVRYGTFDEYVFGSPSRQNLAEFKSVADGWHARTRAPLRYADYADWPGILSTHSFHVQHLGGWGHFMPGLHYVRARLTPAIWPITGIIHSLHGRDTIDHAVRLASAGMLACDAVFCTSRDGRRALEHLLDGAARIVSRRFQGQLLDVPLGIPDELVETRGDRAAARARLRIEPDAVVVLVLGRLSVGQKMDLAPVCQAFARSVVPAVDTPPILLFAGAASTSDVELVQEAATRHGLANHVRFHVNFPPAQKAAVLAAADVALAPSDNAQETFGLSVLEAQGAGLPVVAARFDGYKDLVRHGLDGFLVDTWQAPTDPLAGWFDVFDTQTASLVHSQGIALDLAQLGSYLRRLATDAVLRRRMGDEGRQKVEQEYRWSRVIPRFEAAWDDLARMARTCAATSSENPFDLGPARVFAHYPSHTLSDGTELVAVDPWQERPYADTQGWLTQPVLERIRRRARNPTSAAELVAAADVSPAQGWFAIAWLIKYGALALAATPPQGDPVEADSPR
ncbi:MAG: glycosyltransferase family 4 protein [Vicinamibacterales bacterium]